MKKRIGKFMALVLSVLMAVSPIAVSPIAVFGDEVTAELNETSFAPAQFDSATPSSIVVDFGEHSAPLTIHDFTIISTAQQLYQIRDNPSGHFILANDIDLSDRVWNPIPTFSGTFDGNGNMVTGVNFLPGTPNPGLFATNDGTIRNLGVEFISARFNGIVGRNNGIIERSGTLPITGHLVLWVSGAHITAPWMYYPIIEFTLTEAETKWAYNFNFPESTGAIIDALVFSQIPPSFTSWDFGLPPSSDVRLLGHNTLHDASN